MIELLGALALAAASAPAEHVFLLHDRGEPALSIHHVEGAGRSVLFVHGATFPSALSINYRIDGRSWADDLHERGFDVWSFDFAGYGDSDRPAAMKRAGRDAEHIPGRSADASRQIERVAVLIRKQRHASKVSIIAHSWGTIPAGLFAGARAGWVDRLVLFGPVAPRPGNANPPDKPAAFVDADHQWASFQSGLPQGQASLISKDQFDRWITAYLATDRESSSRAPPSVAVPSGPQADFADAWSGHLPYDPGLIAAPTLIVRGEWDAIARDQDADWLKKALSRVPGGVRDIKLANGAHRMHLEANRQALFDAVGRFLSEDAP